MASSLKEFNDNTLYPEVFERLDQVLPEFEFKRQGSSWVSGNKLKVTGEPGNKQGAVVVYHDRPYYLKDYTRGGMAMTEYLQSVGKANDWIGAVKYLSEVTGISLPGIEFSPEESARYKEGEKRAAIYEAANDLFLASIGKSHEAMEYLAARGFKPEMLKSGSDPDQSKAEIGLSPNHKILKEYLGSRGFLPSEVEDLLMANLSPIATNRLTIPIREPYGRIKGFAFRSISEDDRGRKYLYSKGLDKSSLIFNLKALRGAKDLVFVEGLLDALHAQALGVENVVALGGTSLNVNQVKIAQRSGAEKITLCLDNDNAGIKATRRVIETIRETAPEIDLYVASLPQTIKDPDELIAKDGIEAFKMAIKQADSWLGFCLNDELSKYGVSTAKDRGDLLKSFLNTFSQTDGATDRELVLDRYAEKMAPFGITKTTLEVESESLKQAIKKKEEAKRIMLASEKAALLAKEGKLEEAKRLLSKHGKHNKTEITKDTLTNLLKPFSEKDLIKSLNQKPESIPSGYTLGYDELLIPAGAITILAGPTSHGKTSFLLNLALNTAKGEGVTKPVHFFSYEEGMEAIVIKGLNIFANTDLSRDNRKTIPRYLRGDSSFVSHKLKGSLPSFESKKEDFFENHVGKTIHFHYENYYTEDLVEAINWLHRDGHVGAVYIDYMQLLKAKSHQGHSRQEEIKHICLALKECAVDTGLPIILGAQFNRSVTDINKIHETAIGEAGDIERIANLILGFWNSTKDELEPSGRKPEGSKIFVKVLKGRDMGSGAENIFGFNGNTGAILDNPKRKDESPF